ESTNPLDLALQGPGMFAVRLADGTTAYSRNGRFHLSPTGQLTTEGGNLVLDTNSRPIQFPDPQGAAIVIRRDGSIFMGNTPIGRIGLFDATGWRKTGDALFTPSGTTTPSTSTNIQQSMLESANVDLSQTMSMIMNTQRSFEVASQMQRMQDQILQQS